MRQKTLDLDKSKINQLEAILPKKESKSDDLKNIPLSKSGNKN